MRGRANLTRCGQDSQKRQWPTAVLKAITSDQPQGLDSRLYEAGAGGVLPKQPHCAKVLSSRTGAAQQPLISHTCVASQVRQLKHHSTQGSGSPALFPALADAEHYAVWWAAGHPHIAIDPVCMSFLWSLLQQCWCVCTVWWFLCLCLHVWSVLLHLPGKFFTESDSLRSQLKYHFLREQSLTSLIRSTPNRRLP